MSTYVAGSSGRRDQRDALQEKAIRIIKPLVPPDAEDRVGRTVRQMNAVIRDHIRLETGLRLTDSQTTSSIPIRVTEGFPAAFARLIGKYDDPVLWRLIAAQPRLGGIVEGLHFLLQGWGAFEQWRDLPAVARDSRPSLERARDVALALQKVAVSKKVNEELAAIHEDILGTYNFPAGKAPWIEIYWMPIALISAMLNVRIEDMTIVTLAHELAHGYTHLGRDIDGGRWETPDFAKSAAEAVEGLAQFYADIVTDKMSARTPGANTAFRAFLQLQSGPYREHEKWQKAMPQQLGETVRFAMLAARNHGAVTVKHWDAMLKETAVRLKREEKPNTGQPMLL